ncbi:hypothetical protein [Cochlodiniinecator piscidefendens]|uniref:hypothetical protein n=1 Tax=Cochlodiniinecator piscidefendens TaxID=2715756 RepID=UPI0014085851|nr:hypothetical protein [Cochlodiniinecator piscidefendens]
MGFQNFDPRLGAESLIRDAIGATKGDSIAIIAEDPSLGIYDAVVPECVADVASELGISTQIIKVGDHAGLNDIPAEVKRALSQFDHVFFHSRLGDTLRFSDIPGSASKTMSYALDVGVLGGPSCTVPHRLMEDIRAAYDAQANSAKKWHITCPHGTDISGSQDIEAIQAGEAEDFTVTRYPVCAPRPISCASANGVVALTNWLMASGNQKYPDDELLLPEVVMAEVKDGKIIAFDGPKALTEKVHTHYKRVGHFLGIDPMNVHSWHAGINPGCFYPIGAKRNIERWGKVAFANPRYLHFHTCGNYAPGEIAWTVFDATAKLDNKVFWREGRFEFLDDPQVKALLNTHGHSELVELNDIGIA